MGPKKVTEDKTFGMKNKNRSAQVQKKVAAIQKSMETKGKSAADQAKERARADAARQKAADEAKKREIAEMYSGGKSNIVQAKVPFGTDPKSILCNFFKAGLCDKGNKCKFSHNLNVERKSEKRSLYEDERVKDVMENWDDTKLQQVVLSKHGNPQTTTTIVCKYFLEAIEDKKYGWFWQCKNGDQCKYKHALPPGFKLKAQIKAEEVLAKKDVISLEEFIETERHKLGPNLTPVTAESFAEWKKSRLDKKKAEQELLEKAKESQKAAGKGMGMSGRDMFTYHADAMGLDDESDDEVDLTQYRRDANRRPEEEVQETYGQMDEAEILDDVEHVEGHENGDMKEEAGGQDQDAHTNGIEKLQLED